MSNNFKVSLNAHYGATLDSPNFFEIEEITTDDLTIADIETGILDGSYTPIDPELYTYEGAVASDYGKAVIYSIVPVISIVTINGTVTGTGVNTYKVLKFRIPPSVTSAWDNKSYQLKFDIKRTEIADTDNVDVWVRGDINVLPTVTG